RPAFHLQGRPRMVGQDEDRAMVRRIRPPPSLPPVVRPRAAARREHVAAQDPRPDLLEPAGHEIVVEPRRPLPAPVNLLEGPGRKHPLVERQAADPEGVLQALAGTGPVAVQRDPERVDPELRHGLSPKGLLHPPYSRAGRAEIDTKKISVEVARGGRRR